MIKIMLLLGRFMFGHFKFIGFIVGLFVLFVFTACHINLHRNCISHYTDLCPGKHPGKGMKTKIMDKIRNEKDQKRKQSANFIQSK